MKTSLLLSISLIMFCLSSNYGQEAQLGLLAKKTENGTKFKIIPKDAYTWITGLDNGFVISKRDLTAGKDFIPIHDGVLNASDKDKWLTIEKGQEMFEFHTESVSKIRNMLDNNGSFLQSFRQLQRADENYKMYIFITMRDQEFGDNTGLEFTEQVDQSDKTYEYKVSIPNTDIESNSIMFSNNRVQIPPSLSATEMEKAVKLSWIHDEDSPIIAYYIERSETGIHYERITDGPKIPQNYDRSDTIERSRAYEDIFVDSLISNYQPYHYRLVALDVWGDEWNPSAPIIAKGIDLTPPKIDGFTIEVDSLKRAFVLDWERCEDADIESYFVMKSSGIEGVDTVLVQDILPGQKTSYTYDNPLESQNYYFKIGAIDTAGNYDVTKVQSVFINDITSPKQINSILHEVDTLGRVSLDWSPMIDTNPYGYWIFKSYDKSSNYIKITDTVINETSFVDTCSIALLNHEVYYYIVAVDKSYNRSHPSDIIEVQLPDTIPPPTTYISEVIDDANQISILWNANQSDDVINYYVYKKTPTHEWQVIGEVSSDKTAIEYSELAFGQLEYKVLAMDKSGNLADNSFIYVFNRRESVSDNFEINIEKEEGAVSIKWNNIGSKYKLYQSTDDAFRLVDFIGVNSYSIPADQLSKKTSFYVKAFNDNGRLISSSQTIEI